MNAELEQILFLKGKSHLPHVLIAASECSPLSKTGGLADVAGALPKALGAMGFDARIITPYHRCFKGKYDDKIEHLGEYYVKLGWRTEYAGLEKLTLDGVIYYLVDSEYYFGDVIYRGGEGEVEQYAFFQRAVLDLIPMLDFEPEVLHCNDWQTAMLPMLLKTQYGYLPQGKLKTVFSIHNLAFQGWLSPERAADLLNVEPRWQGYDGIGHGEWCNFMKGGVLFSEKVNTVSPSYADEIRTPAFGEGMDGVLLRRGADVSGILNGIDTNEFNPATDPRIPYHFDAEHPEKKIKDKAKLIAELGLETSVDTPIIAMVTRMTRQKGFDLVLQGLDELMARDVAFVLLGSGDHDYESAMRFYEGRYKGRLCAYVGYSEDVARKIYAGADFLLMPSAFEPCGLSQMIAQRYGTLPIVHEVGGLRDTVTPYNRDTGEGDGFSFYDYNTGTMLGVISYALSVYNDKPVMNRLIHAAMTRDVSMGKCALEYAKLYVDIVDSEKSEVLHLPGDEIYRSPMGAVRSGETVRFRLRAADFAAGVKLVAGGREYPMEHIRDGLLSVEFTAPKTPGLVHYSFRLGEGVWYGADGLGTHPMQPWQLTVYDASFRTPAWAEGTVMYQIFPDRYARGGDAFEKGAAYHRKLGRNVEIHEDWDEPVKFWATTKPDYNPDDFYGGTLRGVMEQLPELDKNGVGC
ncbi:MAG: glycogen/starch synthase, partial [Oscillospiraceae bacterium]|nr:glycogen/starch synthase [Oscillospiraceae bacterium]